MKNKAQCLLSKKKNESSLTLNAVRFSTFSLETKTFIEKTVITEEKERDRGKTRKELYSSLIRGELRRLGGATPHTHTHTHTYSCEWYVVSNQHFSRLLWAQQCLAIKTLEFCKEAPTLLFPGTYAFACLSTHPHTHGHLASSQNNKRAFQALKQM